MPPKPKPLPTPSPKFTAKKTKILSALSIPRDEYTDKSPKGSVDAPILGLIGLINGLEGVVTTSSCSGRVSVFVEGETKGIGSGFEEVGGVDDDGEEENSEEDDREGESTGNEGENDDFEGMREEMLVTDAEESKTKRKRRKKVKGGPGGKGGGRWLFVSHDPLDLEMLASSPLPSSARSHPRTDEHCISQESNEWATRLCGLQRRSPYSISSVTDVGAGVSNSHDDKNSNNSIENHNDGHSTTASPSSSTKHTITTKYQTNDPDLPSNSTISSTTTVPTPQPPISHHHQTQHQQQKQQRLIKLSFSPLILHIHCATLHHARPLLAAAINAGFRESGVQSLKALDDEEVGCMIGIRSAGLGFETVVGRVIENNDNGVGGSDGTTINKNSKDDDDKVEDKEIMQALVNEAYLRLCLSVINERFKWNVVRTERLKKEIDRIVVRLGRGLDGRRSGWEDGDERRRRKREEGLARQREKKEKEKEKSTNGKDRVGDGDGAGDGDGDGVGDGEVVKNRQKREGYAVNGLVLDDDDDQTLAIGLNADLL